MRRVKPVRASALCEELRVQVRSDIYRIEDVVKGIAADPDHFGLQGLGGQAAIDNVACTQSLQVVGVSW